MNSDEDLSSASSSSSPQQTRFFTRGFQHSLEDNLSTKSNRKIAKFRSFAKKKDLSQIYARPSDFYYLGRPETRDIDIDIDFDIDFFFKLGFTSRLYFFGILQISWGKLVGAIVRYDTIIWVFLLFLIGRKKEILFFIWITKDRIFFFHNLIAYRKHVFIVKKKCKTCFFEKKSIGQCTYKQTAIKDGTTDNWVEW